MVFNMKCNSFICISYDKKINLWKQRKINKSILEFKQISSSKANLTLV